MSVLTLTLNRKAHLSYRREENVYQPQRRHDTDADEQEGVLTLTKRVLTLTKRVLTLTATFDFPFFFAGIFEKASFL